ncbi:unnamed protein product [Brassica napus]|uniref:(rape) hypothetical protein n=1 Tax=Brassica napus TaxID=3708 RepID=A0A816JC12_BRANA|nr:unnamed protein product [Brassica napus]
MSWRFHTYIHQDPSLSTPYIIALAADEENNIQDSGDEYSRERINRVMDFFKTASECFFVGWFWGYVLFFLDNSSQDYGSILYRLSMGFFAFSCIRYVISIVTSIIFPFVLCGFLVQIACYACIIRPFELYSERKGEDIVSNNYHGLDSEWESDGEDIVGKKYTSINRASWSGGKGTSAEVFAITTSSSGYSGFNIPSVGALDPLRR